MKLAYNLLIVDDVSDNIKVAMNILKENNYKFSFATNGEQALDIVKNSEFDLILLDIMMPKMDGYETSTLIRGLESYKTVPIIAVTANAMLGDKEKCLNAGANDYMSKPIDIEKLFVMMQMWLQSK